MKTGLLLLQARATLYTDRAAAVLCMQVSSPVRRCLRLVSVTTLAAGMTVCSDHQRAFNAPSHSAQMHAAPGCEHGGTLLAACSSSWGLRFHPMPCGLLYDQAGAC